MDARTGTKGIEGDVLSRAWRSSANYLGMIIYFISLPIFVDGWGYQQRLFTPHKGARLKRLWVPLGLLIMVMLQAVADASLRSSANTNKHGLSALRNWIGIRHQVLRSLITVFGIWNGLNMGVSPCLSTKSLACVVLFRLGTSRFRDKAHGIWQTYGSTCASTEGKDGAVDQS